MRTLEYLYLFCTWHTNAKCFSPCVYSYFHRRLSDNFILSQKMSTFGLYEYKVEGSGCGFNRKRGLGETDS